MFPLVTTETKNYLQYFDRQTCPVCQSSSKKTVYRDLLHTCNVLRKIGLELKNEDVPSDVDVCMNCGHKYLSLKLKDQLIDYYYAVVDSEYYDTVRNDPHDRRLSDTKKFAELIFDKCRDCTSVLEIGSGMGHLLSELQKKGYDCTGVDPSEFASSYARKQFKLNVVIGLLHKETFPGKKFDVIILSDVVEHVYRINEFFNILVNYLAENGRVVVLTGNSNSFYARLCGRKWLYFFSWEHISFFNRSSIQTLFKQHSLSLDYFKTTKHTGSYWQNVKSLVLTFRSGIANLLGLRNHRFYYYQAFDHFVAIGRNLK